MELDGQGLGAEGGRDGGYGGGGGEGGLVEAAEEVQRATSRIPVVLLL